MTDVPSQSSAPTQSPSAQATKYCHACGKQLDVRAEICPHCGVRQPSLYSAFGPTTPSGRNRLVAALLALILGGLGIHKFYLGRIAQGVIYLIFFWTIIPMIIGFIEGIIYLTMTDGEFAAKYG